MNQLDLAFEEEDLSEYSTNYSQNDGGAHKPSTSHNYQSMTIGQRSFFGQDSHVEEHSDEVSDEDLIEQMSDFRSSNSNKRASNVISKFLNQSESAESLILEPPSHRAQSHSSLANTQSPYFQGSIDRNISGHQHNLRDNNKNHQSLKSINNIRI
jgi:hypothetical protein